MPRNTSPTVDAPPAVAFEVERFGWAGSDRLEVTGRWFGLRGHRFMRPALIVEAGDDRRRLLALLEHKPWTAHEGEEWVAAFAWKGEVGKFESAELNVGSGIDLELPSPRMSPGKPRRFRQRDGERRRALQLADRCNQLADFFEKRLSIRVATTQPQMTEHDQCRNAADRCGARTSSHRFRIFGGRLPIALFEVAAGAPRTHVSEPGIQIVTFAVGDSFIEPMKAALVFAPDDAIRTEVGIRARGVFLEAMIERDAQTLLEIVPSAGIASSHSGRTEIVQRMRENFVVAIVLRQGNRTPRPVNGRC